jgi:biopolymer transport protein ExbD
VVTPGKANHEPPADAVVLFDGTNLDSFIGKEGKKPAWKVEDGYMEMTPTGDLWTKQEFGDMQLHIEWASPSPPQSNSQHRGNSGIFLMNRYEIQVLDCYNNKTYADGHAGGIYGQYPPLVNASRKPGEWQTYDIIFTAPRFKAGEVETPAYVTVIHNGVVVQNHSALLGETTHKKVGQYKEHPAKGAIRLQDHNDKQPVRYRNIWVRGIEPKVEENAFLDGRPNKPSALDIDIPAGDQSAPEVVISIDAAGAIELGEGKNVSALDLKKTLERLQKSNPDSSVIVRGDSAAKWQSIVAVLNVCQSAKIWNVAFSTSKPKAEAK